MWPLLLFSECIPALKPASCFFELVIFKDLLYTLFTIVATQLYGTS